MILLSLFVTFGIGLHIVENTIPVPFPIPGAKLGLANTISLLTLAIYGFKEGLIVSVLRCIISSLLVGSLSSLLYSLSGAISSIIVMGFVYNHFKNTFSLVGISVLGGITHNFAQITVASFILSTFGLYVYLPFLMVSGLLTGLFIGILANFLKRHLVTTLIKIKFLGEEQIENEKKLS